MSKYLDHLGRDRGVPCDDDLTFAQELVCSIYEKNFKKGGVGYKPSDTMMGVLKQIHNLTWYMVKQPPVIRKLRP